MDDLPYIREERAPIAERAPLAYVSLSVLEASLFICPAETSLLHLRDDRCILQEKLAV